MSLEKHSFAPDRQLPRTPSSVRIVSQPLPTKHTGLQGSQKATPRANPPSHLVATVFAAQNWSRNQTPKSIFFLRSGLSAMGQLVSRMHAHTAADGYLCGLPALSPGVSLFGASPAARQPRRGERCDPPRQKSVTLFKYPVTPRTRAAQGGATHDALDKPTAIADMSTMCVTTSLGGPFA